MKNKTIFLPLLLLPLISIAQKKNIKPIQTTKEINYKELCKKEEVALTGEVYKIPVHHQPLWTDKFNPDDFPVTNHFCSHHICPALYPELTEKQVIHVCNTLKRINDEN
jgi:dTDP-4-amino-4,6-dideoxygalactose transaminase